MKTLPESRTSPHPALSISAATTRAAIASARLQPVSQMTRPAIVVATKAYRSLSMCWKAPSTLRLDRFALLSIQVAAMLTAMPASPVATTYTPSTEGGVIRRPIPSYTK